MAHISQQARHCLSHLTPKIGHKSQNANNNGTCCWRAIIVVNVRKENAIIVVNITINANNLIRPVQVDLDRILFYSEVLLETIAFFSGTPAIYYS